MATQYDPIAKDGSLNTTEATPRNIADVLAEGLKGIEDALPPTYTEGDGIDISNNEISVDTTFAEASTRANIASGDTLSTILGKIKKFFTDLKTVAFTGNYSDLSGTENVAVKNASNQFSENQTINTRSGTASTTGASSLTIGNNIAAGTAENSRGLLTLYGNGSNFTTLRAPDSTANRVIDLPNNSGTLALTSDVQNNYIVTSQHIPSTSISPLGYYNFNISSSPSGYTLVGARYEPTGAYGTYTTLYIISGQLTVSNLHPTQTADAKGDVTFLWKKN